MTFTGFISNQSLEFRRIVSTADISVVPSVFEPQGNVVLESLAMGIPVVASRVGGIPQMVPESVGCLVKPKNSLDLSNKLQYLERNSDILDAMRRKCRNFVEKQFSWRNSAERHIEAFEELIQISQTSKIKAHLVRKFTPQSGYSPTSTTKRLPDSV